MVALTVSVTHFSGPMAAAPLLDVGQRTVDEGEHVREGVRVIAGVCGPGGDIDRRGVRHDRTGPDVVVARDVGTGAVAAGGDPGVLFN